MSIQKPVFEPDLFDKADHMGEIRRKSEVGPTGRPTPQPQIQSLPHRAPYAKRQCTFHSFQYVAWDDTNVCADCGFKQVPR